MFVLEVVVGAAVLIGVAFLATGRANTLDDEPEDYADPGLPTDRPMRSDDVERLRFRVGLRGYRMSDVDAAMTALQQSLHQLEERTRETR